MPSAPPVVLGSQVPRLWSAPPAPTSAADDAIRAAATAGLILDPWQCFVLQHSLGENPDGTWATPTVCLICARQNGKNAILEAIELAALFVWDERAILHTAHEQRTASDQFRRVLARIQNTPEYADRLDRPIRGKGSESIILKTGQTILFATRTSGAGRGLTEVDRIVCDESYELPEAATSALVPITSASPNPQTWYTSTAVDQQKHHHGLTLARYRARGMAGTPGLAFFEWSAEGDDPAHARNARDPEVIAQANPGLGIRIALETAFHEHDVSMGPREFAVERLSIGDYPPVDVDGDKIIPPTVWKGCYDPDSRPEPEPIVLAFDVSPKRTSAVGAAGRNAAGVVHVELVEHKAGTSWLPGFLVDLIAARNPVFLLCDPKAPAGALLPDLEEAGIVEPDEKAHRPGILRLVNATEHAQAAGMFLADVQDRRLRQVGQPDLDAAVDGAKVRPLGDAWLWDRKAGVDISPLVAVTLARWGLAVMPAKRPRSRVVNLANV